MVDSKFCNETWYTRRAQGDQSNMAPSINTGRQRNGGSLVKADGPRRSEIGLAFQAVTPLIGWRRTR